MNILRKNIQRQTQQHNILYQHVQEWQEEKSKKQKESDKKTT